MMFGLAYQVERLHQQLSDAQQRIESVEEENQQLQNRVDKLKHTIRKIQSDSKSKRARAKALEHQQISLQKECDELHESIIVKPPANISEV